MTTQTRAPTRAPTRAIGLMSGTSLDGIDVAWLETDGERISQLGPYATLLYEDDFRADLRRLLQRFHLYQFDAVTDFESAARIYRRCRQAGITPRGLVDCMIAAVAQRHQATLLACDRDLEHVARVMGIELDRPA